MVNAQNKINTLHSSGQTIQTYNRLEITAIEPRKILMQYFSKYPLRLQQRHIDFLRWVRVHGYQQRGVKLSERSGIKLAKLLAALSESELTSEIQNDLELFS